MLRHIQNLAYTAVGLMHTAYNAVQVQPFQIDGENPFQNGGKEEGWQRNTDQCKYCHRIVYPAVLFGRRYNTQRYGDYDFQQERRQRQYKRIPDYAGKFLGYRLMENPRFSKFTVKCLAKPYKITFQNRLVQSVGSIQFRNQFVIRLCALFH